MCMQVLGCTPMCKAYAPMCKACACMRVRACRQLLVLGASRTGKTHLLNQLLIEKLPKGKTLTVGFSALQVRACYHTWQVNVATHGRWMLPHMAGGCCHTWQVHVATHGRCMLPHMACCHTWLVHVATHGR